MIGGGVEKHVPTRRVEEALLFAGGWGFLMVSFDGVRLAARAFFAGGR